MTDNIIERKTGKQKCYFGGSLEKNRITFLNKLLISFYKSIWSIYFRCYLIQLSEFQVYSHIDVVKLGNISVIFYDLQNFPDTNNSQNDEFYEAKYK